VHVCPSPCLFQECQFVSLLLIRYPPLLSLSSLYVTPPYSLPSLSSAPATLSSSDARTHSAPLPLSVHISSKLVRDGGEQEISIYSSWTPGTENRSLSIYLALVLPLFLPNPSSSSFFQQQRKATASCTCGCMHVT
jgi:hypothetical protein